MPDQSTWSDLFAKQQLAKLGMKALRKGAVTPDQAKAEAKNMGLNPDSQDPAQPGTQAIGALSPSDANVISMNPPSQSGGPMSMASSPMDLYNSDGMSGAQGVKGMMLQDKRNENSGMKRMTNRVLTKSPDQIRAERLMAQGIYPKVSGYDATTDERGNPVRSLGPDGQPTVVLDKSSPQYDFSDQTVDPSDPVQQQERGLDRMTDLLKIQNEAASKRNMIDFSPLARLADAWAGNGQNLAAASPKVENNGDQFMAEADEIQKRRADINKGTAEGLKAQKGGTALDQLTQLMAQQQLAQQGSPNQNNRMDVAMFGAAHRGHQKFIDSLQKDPLVKGELQGYNRIANSLSGIANAQHLGPSAIHEAQQAIASAAMAGSGSSSIGDERAQRYIQDAGWNLDNFMQFIQGKPADIAKDDALLGQIKDYANIESKNMKNLLDRRVNALSGGYGWIYNDPQMDPDGRLAQSRDDALAGTKAQYAPAGPTYTAKPKAHKADPTAAAPMSFEDWKKANGR